MLLHGGRILTPDSVGSGFIELGHAIGTYLVEHYGGVSRGRIHSMGFLRKLSVSCCFPLSPKLTSSLPSGCGLDSLELQQ